LRGNIEIDLLEEKFWEYELVGLKATPPNHYDGEIYKQFVLEATIMYC
jgi:hypothetical protein